MSGVIENTDSGGLKTKSQARFEADSFYKYNYL